MRYACWLRHTGITVCTLITGSVTQLVAEIESSLVSAHVCHEHNLLQQLKFFAILLYAFLGTLIGHTGAKLTGDVERRSMAHARGTRL